MTRSWPLGALTALAALAGCGGGGEQDTARSSTADLPSRPVDINPGGTNRAGSVAQLADCASWRSAGREERFAIIADIRGQHTPQRSKDARSPLPDEDAYDIFQRACKPDYADTLRLYKLYVRVQGFAPLREP
jgi:hypothetical protein